MSRAGAIIEAMRLWKRLIRESKQGNAAASQLVLDMYFQQKNNNGTLR